MTRTVRFSVLPLLVAALVGGLFACRSEPPATPAPVDPDYLAEIEAWHANRDERLRSETGWLSLVGLHWLDEAEHSFGSDPENSIVFPEKAPPIIGVLRLAEGEVSIAVEPGVEATSGGVPVQEMVMATDDTGQATEIEVGSLLFYAIRRAERVAIRVKDRESEKLATFEGIERFPVDPAWRVEARFERYAEPKIIEVPNVVGTVFEETCEGAVVFEYEGESYRLDAISELGGDLFLIFGDPTNGHETYGAGRFLYADPPTEDDTVVLDFNRAYNPPCAFTPFATCPLPPSQNKLDLRIEAGEKNYGAH